jgi:hypothetical protein
MRAVLFTFAAVTTLVLAPLLVPNSPVAQADPAYHCTLGLPSECQRHADECAIGTGPCFPGEVPGCEAGPVCRRQVPTVAPSQVRPNPQAPNVKPPTKAAPLPPPRNLEAPPDAVAAAKSAPAAQVDPADPPKPPTEVDVKKQVQEVLTNHRGNVDIVRANNQDLARPRHWGFLDYDAYHRPSLYNPLKEAMTFRYHYSGAFREVQVPAGGRIVLDAAVGGVFPFTAVSGSYVAAGSFTGGAFVPPSGWSGPPPPSYTPPAPPKTYRDVSVYVPAKNQTVQVGQVQVAGRDQSQPPGSQDVFMLDDNTLAWGQVNDPRDGGQVSVVRTQSLPGIGPIDDGSYLVALTALEQPTHNNWWPWALGGGALAIAAGLVTAVIIRRRRSADIAG